MTACNKGAAPARLLPRTSLLSQTAVPILLTLGCVLSSSGLNQGRQWASAIEESGFQVNVTGLLSKWSWFSAQSTAPDLIVHEWGTFTSIAGSNGQAMDWLPLTASTELPAFVEHFRDVQFKGGLRGTIRMETPVLYFYSPRETNVSVNVSFARGLITEWYPRATSANPSLSSRDLSLYNTKTAGGVSWNSVHIDPHGSTAFPRDNSEDHYFAARSTASAPLELETSTGPQREKFLFYRGVAAFSLPLNATLASDNAVQLQNHFTEPIPNVILFERRGARAGYSILGPLRNQASLAPVELSSSVDSLESNLEGMLVSQGLFADEAHAMVETWKNSWFEEGSRLLYIVPRSFTDSVLPLRVTPAPATTIRVFVGRLELVTPATEQAVESAFATNDRATLARYSRFLEPILITLLQKSNTGDSSRRLRSYLMNFHSMDQINDKGQRGTDSP
jgi:hypothetical protein